MAATRPDDDITMAIDAHRRLTAEIEAAIAGGGLDVAAPSTLPDWSKGHVLTHIINSGDGHAGIFSAASVGEVRAQYPHGVEGRAADIEAGAPRPAEVQLAELRRSIETLEACWESTNWEGFGITPRGGEIAIAELPFLRAREVLIHLVDLDVGVGFEDLPARYLNIEVDRMTMLWSAKQSTRTPSLPAEALALTAPERLAWLMGRTTVDGLDAAAVF